MMDFAASHVDYQRESPIIFHFFGGMNVQLGGQNSRPEQMFIRFLVNQPTFGTQF
jgi:hypothetical protein